MDNAGAWRDDPEVLEGPLGELEKLITLLVSAKFQRHILLVGSRRSKVIDLDRMVDDQVAWYHRVDALGVAAHCGHRIAHRGQIDHARHPGKVLEDDPGRHERDFVAGRPAGPPGNLEHVVLGDDASPRVSEGILHEDSDRKGQVVQLHHPLSGEFGEAEHHRTSGSEVKPSSRAERIG